MDIGATPDARTPRRIRSPQSVERASGRLRPTPVFSSSSSPTIPTSLEGRTTLRSTGALRSTASTSARSLRRKNIILSVRRSCGLRNAVGRPSNEDACGSPFRHRGDRRYEYIDAYAGNAAAELTVLERGRVTVSGESAANPVLASMFNSRASPSRGGTKTGHVDRCSRRGIVRERECTADRVRNAFVGERVRQAPRNVDGGW